MTSGAVRVRDVSQITRFRERLGRGASALKLVGVVSAVAMTLDGSRYVNGWIAFAGGVLLLCSAFPLGKRLRAGQMWAAALVAIWLVLYFAWSVPALPKAWAGFDFYTAIGLVVIYLPVYFATCAVLELRAYKTRPPEPAATVDPLNLNPWEDGVRGSRKHPIFLNKKSLRAYLFILAVPVVWLFVAASAMNRSEPQIANSAELAGRRTADVLISGLVWMLMVYLYRRARRHALLPGNELLKRDKRGIVLYLRSFMDDRGIRIRARPNDGRIFPERFMKISFEELVTDHLWRYGPVVAIGDPRRKRALVPLGAARDFEQDDTWQMKATDLMRQAALIVAVAGSARGFLWELTTIVDHGLASRLLLLLPPLKREELAMRWEAIANEAPGLDMPRDLDLIHVRAVLFQNGSTVVITADKRNEWTYETVLDDAALSILAA